MDEKATKLKALRRAIAQLSNYSQTRAITRLKEYAEYMAFLEKNERQEKTNLVRGVKLLYENEPRMKEARRWATAHVNNCHPPIRGLAGKTAMAVAAIFGFE